MNFPVKSVPQRYILVTMTFMVIVNIISLRSCLSLALTQMVATITIDENAPADYDTCPVENVANQENGTLVTIQVGVWAKMYIFLLLTSSVPFVFVKFQNLKLSKF